MLFQKSFSTAQRPNAKKQSYSADVFLKATKLYQGNIIYTQLSWSLTFILGMSTSQIFLRQCCPSTKSINVFAGYDWILSFIEHVHAQEARPQSEEGKKHKENLRGAKIMIMTHEPAITRITIFFCISCYSSWSYFINGSNLFLKSPIFSTTCPSGVTGGGTGAYPSSQSKRYKVHSGQVDCPLQ